MVTSLLSFEAPAIECPPVVFMSSRPEPPVLSELLHPVQATPSCVKQWEKPKALSNAPSPSG